MAIVSRFAPLVILWLIFREKPLCRRAENFQAVFFAVLIEFTAYVVVFLHITIDIVFIFVIHFGKTNNFGNKTTRAKIFVKYY